MRHKKTKRRITEPDKVYKNRLVGKFINRLMKDGKKTVAQKAFYGALDIISQKNQDALSVFERALQTVSPRQEVRARRVGGANYQIPTEVRADRKTSLSIRWLIQAAKKRPSTEYHSFSAKLAAELMDAIENKGEAVKKKDTMQKMADANKAFSHFRW